MGLLLRLLVALAVCLAISVASGATPPAPTPELMKTGKAVYQINCAACHGVTGEGNGPVAFAVKPPPRNFVKEPFKAGDAVDQIFKTVTTGLPNTKMVGYPNLDEQQRWALAYYVRAFRVTK